MIGGDDAAWECTHCGAGYYAYHFEPEQEEFWSSFDHCEDDCPTALKHRVE